MYSCTGSNGSPPFLLRLNLSNTNSLRGCAKITAYNGISIEYFDHFTIGYLPELADTNALLVSGGELCAIFNLRTYGGNPDSPSK